MRGIDVVVLPTGAANLASVLAAFRRLGADPKLAEAPADVEAASHVVVPGVGTFEAALRGLEALRLSGPLAARLEAGRPVMATCVGLQILFESSDECPGARGLGVLKGHVGRFPTTVRVPQFGWNRIEPGPGCRLLQPGFAYFANSYRVQAAPGFELALASHGEPFVAGFERGALLACQFHAELSGRFGHDLMARWLELTSC